MAKLGVGPLESLLLLIEAYLPSYHVLKERENKWTASIVIAAQHIRLEASQ